MRIMKFIISYIHHLLMFNYVHSRQRKKVRQICGIFTGILNVCQFNFVEIYKKLKYIRCLLFYHMETPS